jgi:hypothetical protein
MPAANCQYIEKIGWWKKKTIICRRKFFSSGANSFGIISYKKAHDEKKENLLGF